MNRILKKLNRELYPRKLFFPPEWLVLGVNNICNLHCKMCDVGVQNTKTNFYENLMGSKPINMPLELIRLVLNQCNEFFPSTKIGYAFTEPLIYPHLIPSLEIASELGLFTAITTNALNLKHKAEALCQSGLNEIYISLDGLEKTHNFIRGHKSSFQRAIEGIEWLLKQNSCPEIHIYLTITQWNTGELKQFVDFFRKYELAKLGLMHTVFTDNKVVEAHNLLYGHKYNATSSNLTEIDIDQMNLVELWEQIVAIKQDSYNFEVSFSPEVDSFSALQDFYLKPSIPFGKKCNDASRTMMIKSNGTVIPAQGRCYNVEMGNLEQDNLQQIWNSNTFQAFRNDLKKAGGLFPACTRCCSAY